jgi:hypothetical protein
VTDVAELPRAETGTATALIVSQTPVVVLTDKEKRAEFYAHIQAEVDSFEPDISTLKGRDAIKSLAYKITRTKTAIDAAGKELNDEARQRINAVDAERRAVREHLDGLAKKVRQPLTEWEEAEKAREAEVDRIITMLRSSRFVEQSETSDSIRERGTIIHNIAIDPDVFQDRADEAEREKKDTVAHLLAAMEQAIKAEKAAEELERLRKAEAERQAAEQAKREAEEAEARRIEEEKRAEEARAAAEKAEQERIAAAAEQARRGAEQAAENERKDAERKREYARQIIDHIKQVGLGMIGGQPQPYGVLLRELEIKIEINDDLGDLQDEVRAIRDATHAQLTASMERAAAKREQEAREEEQRKADEQRRQREADQAHRTAVKTKAKEAIITCGADEETARKIVVAILAGEIPAVRMEF